MAISKKHRKLLSRLCGVCNRLGGVLDSTATSQQKYIDRQRAHMLVYTALYGVLVDEHENDYREENWKDAVSAVEEMEALTEKQYKDRNGN